jgi:hypothetical protein
MRRKILTALFAASALLTALASAQQPALAGAGTHVFYVNGISTIQSQCQYVWKQVGTNPVRDELGIPQPATLPPSCRDGNPAQPGIQPVPCNIKRNLGPYPPPWRPADPVQGEVGLNAPCSGVLTAHLLPAEQGCVDGEADTNYSCDLDAPTWFYGFCGQTYGGDTITDGVGSNATMRINGALWKFEKLGFARGRGVWEFGAKIFQGASPGTATNRDTARFYFGAIPNPNEPANAAGCDGGPAVLSVEFFGTIIIPAPPVKAFRTKPGWHPCADDPILGAGGTEGC